MRNTNTFIHAAEAALTGFHPRIASDQALVEQLICAGIGWGEVHGVDDLGGALVVACAPIRVGAALAGSACANGAFVGGTGGQLGPNGLPVVGQQVLQRYFWVNTVPAPRKLGAGHLETLDDLVEVLLVAIQERGHFVATFWCVIWKCHIKYSNHRLALCKLSARNIIIGLVQ